MHRAAADCCINVRETNVQLTSVISGSLIGGYILTIRDADFEKALIKEPSEYKRTL